MKNNKIKIAVLGTGSIGLRHLRVLNSLSIESIAVPVRKERIKELSKEGYNTAFDIKEAKKMGAIGLIICTDTSRHIKDCNEALDLDYLVLCEKPFSSSVKEANKIKEKVKGNLFVGYNLRFDDGFQELFMRGQNLKDIYYIYSECRSYLPDWRKKRNYLESYSSRENEGGVLLDLSHEIDYLNFFFDKPKSVMGVVKNFGILGIKEEEFAIATMDYGSMASSAVILDYLNCNHSRKCVLSSVDTTLEYDYINKVLRIAREGKYSTYLVRRGKDTLYRREIVEFLRVINGKERDFLCNYSEAVDVLQVVEGWKLSSRRRRKVLLKYEN